jgi:long-chain acyl-CoA synthetase
VNFTRLLHAWARRAPDKEAVVAGGRSVSFNGLWRWIAGASAVYRELGIAPGEAVAIVVPNGVEFLALHFGALAAGIVSLPVKPEYRAFELSRIVADCRPRLLVASRRWLAENGPFLSVPSLATVAVEDLGDLAERGEAGPPLAVPGSAPASLNVTYFGGGVPRAAVLTHANHLYAATGYARHQRFGHDERFLVFLPMAHVYALSGCVNSGLIRGGTLVVIERSTPRAILRAIEEHRITVLSAVPVVYELLARFPGKERYDLSSLRLCVSGGAFLPAAVQREFEAALGWPIVQGYGLTECLPVICNPPGAGNRAGTLGVPGRRDIQVRVLDGRSQPLPAGEVGQIAVRSPTVMREYWAAPEDTARALPDGWLRTGDLGWLDADGYLHFHGLAKPIVNLHGNKVDPLEVAAALETHPAVAAAEVWAAAVEDASRTLAALELRAAVEPAPGREVHGPELQRFLRDRLAGYKVPSRIEVRSCSAGAPRSDAGAGLAAVEPFAPVQETAP